MKLKWSKAQRAFFAKHGRKGGAARAARLTTEEKAVIGRMGALARWGKRDEVKAS